MADGCWADRRSSSFAADGEMEPQDEPQWGSQLSWPAAADEPMLGCGVEGAGRSWQRVGTVVVVDPRMRRLCMLTERRLREQFRGDDEDGGWGGRCMEKEARGRAWSGIIQDEGRSYTLSSTA